MNRVTRFRLRMRQAEWNTHDRLFGPSPRGPRPQVQRYIAVPAPRYTRRSKTRRASAEGQTIVLLAFLLVVLGMTVDSNWQVGGW